MSAKINGKQAKEFYNSDMAEALQSGQNYGRVIFMPELIDARISAAKGSNLLNNWLTAPSIRATGRTKQGNPVVVYAHVDNYLSNPENIKNAKRINGAGIVPRDEFQRLLGLEDNEKVFVVDYDKLKNSSSEVISVEKALEHPQTVPFIGGEERAQNYLKKFRQVYGDNIGIWHCDDLRDEPLGRLLFIGGYDDGLFGSSDLNLDARFVGVRDSAEGTAQKISAPTIEQILQISKECVPIHAQEEFEKRLKGLYK